jgi:hypothetical protein
MLVACFLKSIKKLVVPHRQVMGVVGALEDMILVLTVMATAEHTQSWKFSNHRRKEIM